MESANPRIRESANRRTDDLPLAKATCMLLPSRARFFCCSPMATQIGQSRSPPKSLLSRSVVPSRCGCVWSAHRSAHRSSVQHVAGSGGESRVAMSDLNVRMRRSIPVGVGGGVGLLSGGNVDCILAINTRMRMGNEQLRCSWILPASTNVTLSALSPSISHAVGGAK